ncbi:hypothetical protein DRN52_07670, partial [Thermococci archaeon]
GKTIASGEAGVDDASVIQSALDVLVEGETIFIKAGTYEISETIIIKDIKLRGEGRYQTVLKLADGANTNLIESKSYHENSPTVEWGIYIEDLYLYGNKTNNATGGAIYLRTWGAVLRNLRIREFKGHGIAISGVSEQNANENILENIDVRFCESSHIVLGTYSSDNWIINTFSWSPIGASALVLWAGGNLIINSKFETYRTGEIMIIIGGYQNHIVNCRIAGGNIGIILDGSQSGRLPNKNIIIANQFLRSSTAISLKGTASNVQENVIIANRFRTHDYGIIEEGDYTDYNFFVLNRFESDVTNPITIVGANSKEKLNFGYTTENSGTATFSGDGTTTQFSIAHGLISTPTKVLVTPMTADAASDFYVTADDTNIYINYKSAPPSGTDNLKFSWYAEV